MLDLQSRNAFYVPLVLGNCVQYVYAAGKKATKMLFKGFYARDNITKGHSPGHYLSQPMLMYRSKLGKFCVKLE